MRALLLSLVGLFVVLVATAGRAAPVERRVAFVVGNSAYRNFPALPNPRNDADDMIASLKSLGFDVHGGTDLTRQALRDELRQFARVAQGADAALVFYAGHGLQYRGRNYIVPIDAKLQDEFDLDYETVRVDDVVEELNRADGARILILDACRNLPLAGKTSRDAFSSTGLAKLSGRGLIVAYATQANAVAFDGAGRNSIFTGAFLKAVQEPGLDVPQLFQRVSISVDKQTGGRQTPEVSLSYPGQFFFNRAETDREAWTRVRNSGDPEALRGFIARFPNSFLVDDASEAIQRVEDERRRSGATVASREPVRPAPGHAPADPAAAQKTKEDADRLAWQALQEEQKRRAEARQKLDQERAAADTQEKQRLAAEARRQDDDRRRAEAQAAADARERQRLADLDRKRLADEQRAAEQARAAEEARQRKLAEDKARTDAIEKRRLAEEDRKRAADAQRAEQARLAEEARQTKIAEAQAKADAVERQRVAEADRKRVADEQRAAEQARLAEEARQSKLAEAQAKAETAERQRVADAERKRVADEQRVVEQARLAEADRQRKLAEDSARAEAAERQRLAEIERRRVVEEQRAADQARLAEQARQRQLAEEQRAAEQARLAEESRQRKLAEDAARAEAAERQRLADGDRKRLADEQRAADQARLAEADRQRQVAEEQARAAAETRRRELADAKAAADATALAERQERERVAAVALQAKDAELAAARERDRLAWLELEEQQKRRAQLQAADRATGSADVTGSQSVAVLNGAAPDASAPPAEAGTGPRSTRLSSNDAAQPAIVARKPDSAFPRSALDDEALVRATEAELGRIGCYAGDPSGHWSGGAQAALSRFARQARLGTSPKEPTSDILDDLRNRPAGFCPLECGRGQVAEGDRCVAVAHPKEEPRPIVERKAPKPRPVAQERAEPRPAAQAKPPRAAPPQAPVSTAAAGPKPAARPMLGVGF